MENISNKKLFKKKLNFLNDYSLNDHVFHSHISIQYHGIDLLIHSQNNAIQTDLQSLLPNEWFVKDLSPHNIYIISPSSLNMSLEEYSDESSQDCFSLENNGLAIQRDFAAKILPDGSVVLICEERLGDGFYNFLRWFISEKLIERNKFVLHASCVLDKQGRAHLFLGHSGAGKTTVTKLSSPRKILGDDMNILSMSNDHDVMVEAGAIGGLFNSMIGYDVRVKVKGIYWLSQAKETELIKLDNISASQQLLASFANLHWPTLSAETENKLVETSFSVAQKVDFSQMNFKKDSSFWELLES